MIEAIILPPPAPGERAAYRRAIGRAMAEWPLAEVVARVVVEAGAFRLVRLTAGGVAPVRRSGSRRPRLPAKARPSRQTTIERAARAAIEGAKPSADDGLQARAA